MVPHSLWEAIAYMLTTILLTTALFSVTMELGFEKSTSLVKLHVL